MTACTVHFQHMNGELFPPKNIEVSDNLVTKFHGVVRSDCANTWKCRVCHQINNLVR